MLTGGFGLLPPQAARSSPMSRSTDPSFAPADAPLQQKQPCARHARRHASAPALQPHPLCILFSCPATSPHLRQRARILTVLDSNEPSMQHATSSRRVTGRNLFLPSCFATIVKVLVTRSACPNPRCQRRLTALCRPTSVRHSAFCFSVADTVQERCCSSRAKHPPS